jgi:hypothetical protein
MYQLVKKGGKMKLKIVLEKGMDGYITGSSGI